MQQDYAVDQDAVVKIATNYFRKATKTEEQAQAMLNGQRIVSRHGSWKGCG
jgi:hypothetical protein